MHKRVRKAALVAAVAAAGVIVTQAPGPVAGPASDRAEAQVARRGRPRKFSRPSTAVTLTLPDDVIATLQTLDTDLSRAVVRAVQPLTARSSRATVELKIFGDQTAVIVVPPSRSLKELPGVGFVPLWDGRAMLSFDDGISMAEFELRLGDALVSPTLPAADRVVFRELAAILRTVRLGDGMAATQRSIIVLHASALSRKRERSA
jgi:hypothetical protein